MKLFIILTLVAHTMTSREELYERFARQLWTPGQEPGRPDSKFPPLHETLFSDQAYKYTFDYRNPERDRGVTDLESLIIQRVQHLADKTRVHFYENTVWFNNHRNHIKRFVGWCDNHRNLKGDYYLDTSGTLYEYMAHVIESKKQELIQKEATALPEVTVHNYVR